MLFNYQSFDSANRVARLSHSFGESTHGKRFGFYLAASCFSFEGLRMISAFELIGVASGAAFLVTLLVLAVAYLAMKSQWEQAPISDATVEELRVFREVVGDSGYRVPDLPDIAKERMTNRDLSSWCKAAQFMLRDQLRKGRMAGAS